MFAYGDDVSPVLDALGDPTRRRVLELLREHPLAVGELAERLPVSRPAVSQHLRVLKDAGLVSDHPEGSRRLYVADPSGLQPLRTYLETMWDQALAAFASAAARGSAGDRPNERSRQ